MANFGIFLADDHPIMREGVKSLINSQPNMRVVGEADNGKDAWIKIKATRPDVAVLDVSMPELSGAQATERLKQECPEVKVLALTVHGNRGYMQQLLSAGASGYLLKRTAAQELIYAITVVAAGGVYLDPSLANKFFNNSSRRQNLKHEMGGELSSREEEVLRLIALGYSNKEIASQIDISVRTVETYKCRMMEKLEMASRADIVRYALHQGWLHDS